MFHNDSPDNTCKISFKKIFKKNSVINSLNFTVFVWQLLLPVIDHFLKKRSLTIISINGKRLAPCAAKHFFYV